MSFTLSPDQANARADVLAAILADGATEAVLSGPAGSGKTTLMRQLLADFEGAGVVVRLVAPTGKAAARLAELTGRPATTIHAPLYREIIENDDGGVEFAKPHAIAAGRSVVICDEASMVGTRLYGDLKRNLPPSVALLCVGDREQLPPVNDTWGANFAEPTALLTAIHRQAAGSPIIQLATAIRTGADWRSIPPDGAAYIRRRGNVEAVAAWMAGERALDADATVLAYTNRIRQRLNSSIRSARGHRHDLEIGDVLVCTRNAYSLGRMNGELGVVRDFEPVADTGGELVTVTWAHGGRPAIVAPATLAGGMTPAEWARLCDVADEADAVAADAWSRPPTKKLMMMAEYGECLTVHKSQGSQWHTAGVVVDPALDGMAERDPDTFRRLMYTAVTRAARQLIVWEVG